MTERVNTNGNISFVYPKGYQPPRDEELENRIDSAYERYYKKRRIRNWIILGIIILLLIAFILWKT